MCSSRPTTRSESNTVPTPGDRAPSEARHVWPDRLELGKAYADACKGLGALEPVLDAIRESYWAEQEERERCGWALRLPPLGSPGFGLNVSSCVGVQPFA